jgi:putative tricarboxylic transport membrane protein
MSNFVNLWTGLAGLRFWSRVIKAPESVIFTVTLILCIVGVYIATGGLFGVAVMFVFAIIGYLMNAFGYSVIVFIIGFFLGERIELTLSQSLTLIDGDPKVLLSHPVALVLFGLAVAAVYMLGIRPTRRKK